MGSDVPDRAPGLLGRRALTGLLARRLLVVTGKGGAGKTTVAAALGLAAAARGLRVCVAEVAGRDEIARALGAGPAAPFAERELAPGLHHVTVTPEAALEEYLADQLPMRAMAEVLTRSSTFAYLAAATPGFRELLTVGKAYELTEDVRRTPGGERYDLVILDAPATGHGLALLAAPRTFAEAAAVGPIARQARTIHAMLSDPERTGVVAVTTPEELGVGEALELAAALPGILGAPPVLAVADGVLPDRLSAGEARRLEAGDPSRPPIATALRQHERAHRGRAQLARLRRGLRGVCPVVALPSLASPGLGREELAALGARLTREAVAR